MTIPNFLRKSGTLFHSYLHSQAKGVEHDEDKHDIFKDSRVHHIPEFVLVRIFWNVSTQRTGFQSIFYTLTLKIVEISTS